MVIACLTVLFWLVGITVLPRSATPADRSHTRIGHEKELARRPALQLRHDRRLLWWHMQKLPRTHQLRVPLVLVQLFEFLYFCRQSRQRAQCLLADRSRWRNVARLSCHGLCARYRIRRPRRGALQPPNALNPLHCNRVICVDMYLRSLCTVLAVDGARDEQEEGPRVNHSRDLQIRLVLRLDPHHHW